ncbi:MAG TPA: ATP-binding protein [Pyrinomonadaceae bacterium]|nr:ATP-binding protein [Pyrinomonadaceae bacterium]
MALTFRARLTVWYVSATGILLALTAAGLVFALGRIAQRRFDTALWMLGAAEAENAAASLNRRGIDRPDAETVSNTRYREILGYERGPLEKYVTIVDDAGRVADMTDNLASPLPADPRLVARCLAGETIYQTVEVKGVGRVRVVYMPVRGLSVPHPFVVIVGLPESFVAGEMWRFNLLVVLAVVTLLLLTGASAMLLAERAIRPLERVATAAEMIGALNLQERLPEPHTRDHIGRLVGVFNRMLARLEVSFAAQRRFTSRAAHELRTPLTILKGEAQVALRQRRTVKEYEDLLRSSLEETDKLIQIIDDLLLLARYEGGESDIPRERVGLHEVVRKVAEDLRPLAEKRGIDLGVETEELFVEGDASAVERLVCKLLENAVFYTPRGGRVRARVVREGRRARVSVSDTGIGIPAEDLPHLFERFHRSAAAREMRPEGAGIGLSMAAVIARLHGAEIEVESEPGAGARFTVNFPLPESDAR